MATRDCVISGGGSLSVRRAWPAAIYRGGAVACGSVPWNNSTTTPKRKPWLPRADMAWFDPNTGRPTGPFAACMTYLFEEVIGGIAAPTLPQVVTTVEQTQTAVVSVADSTTQLTAYARSIDATASALKQVAVTNSLSGAATVPDPSGPPEPPPTR